MPATSDASDHPGAVSAPLDIEGFLRRWEASGAAERANYALFLSELCDLIGVPRPDPTRPDDADNAYVFERAVKFRGDDATGRIDLYKRGCFILEAKQGSNRPDAPGLLTMPKRTRRGTAVRGTAGWDDAMLKAKGQAELYARHLPPSEPMPPFLIVVDVGHVIELYADFTRSGRIYAPFPDALTHRVRLADLADEATRDRLRLAWTDPLALDPSRRSAKVTREVAAELAKLAQSLERTGHAPEPAAQFLMRCLFTFFAEDAGLLPKDGFTEMLRGLRGQAHLFPDMTRSLWETMKTGGFSPVLRASLLRFNGGLFESAEALAMTDEQLELLIEAGEKQWRDVEPAIFGTLLERALDPIERHKLGAHYTPRAYVERLVMPTIIEPLRQEWVTVQAAALTRVNEGKMDEARDEVRDFLRKLCDTTVLDPACGTGNFLYVTLEHMKRLEGEVWDRLKGLGEGQAAFEGFGLTVDPHQLLGIEINPRAAAIADLVLWIGYLQWHFRTFGDRMPAEPVIHAYHNIECRDAILAHDGTEPLRDESGNVVTRWDGRTMKRHPVTGKEVPDEAARFVVLKFLNPRKPTWPKADYIIGNPPFIGNKPMRLALGDGYVDTIRSIWEEVPDSVDYVMYWWHAAAILALGRDIRQFGFITTNSIVQTFSRQVVQKALSSGLSIGFAIPDHPWVAEEDGASVRVAMTMGRIGGGPGIICKVEPESPDNSTEAVSLSVSQGIITSELTTVQSINFLVKLKSNKGLACPGVQLSGQGFVVSREQLGMFNASTRDMIIKPFLIGNDLLKQPRFNFVIDAFGMQEAELRSRYPDAFQWLWDRVKPERDNNPREVYRRNWWLYSEPRSSFRKALKGIDRIIATCRTAKHRVFTFISSKTISETTVVMIALETPSFLGILSSKTHEIWIEHVGKATLEDRPRYNVSVCFDPFPMPNPSNPNIIMVGELASMLDAHRKARQAQHPTLTLTGMYNVLTKLRAGEPLTEKDRVIHEQGLVSVLKQIHDDLDAAVFDAYGWPRDLADEEILRRLVDLNRERAAEEARGIVRWLRPEFQNPGGARAATQGTLGIADEGPETPEVAASPSGKTPWPKTLAEQARAVAAALASHPDGLTPKGLASTFRRARTDRVENLLETLASLGQARLITGGRYVRA